MDKKKILLVDDSGTVLLMEKMILSKGPFDLLTASSGEEGVKKAVTERPDAILMDLIMPGINGIEACRQIREREDTRDIPIIMVTTKGEMTNVERAYETGVNDYVTKPINALELLTKLNNVLAH
jgi:CheY-like chemotaxis protein